MFGWKGIWDKQMMRPYMESSMSVILLLSTQRRINKNKDPDIITSFYSTALLAYLKT
jgi:hypothetical protein